MWIRSRNTDRVANRQKNCRREIAERQTIMFLKNYSRVQVDDFCYFKKVYHILLTCLFFQGVHSAMQHNTIMESAHPDFALVEVEAERFVHLKNN